MRPSEEESGRSRLPLVLALTRLLTSGTSGVALASTSYGFGPVTGVPTAMPKSARRNRMWTAAGQIDRVGEVDRRARQAAVVQRRVDVQFHLRRHGADQPSRIGRGRGSSRRPRC